MGPQRAQPATATAGNGGVELAGPGLTATMGVTGPPPAPHPVPLSHAPGNLRACTLGHLWCCKRPSLLNLEVKNLLQGAQLMHSNVVRYAETQGATSRFYREIPLQQYASSSPSVRLC